MPRPTVLITRNFAQNLEEIERFWQGRDAPQEFVSLQERLFAQIIPNLRRFPGIGVDFLGRQPGSAEGISSLEGLRESLRKGVNLREYISADYLLLYAIRGDDVFLLSIKHHLQLSFDLKEHWDPTGA